jgi:uncharacterized protein (DUF1778 family)
MASATNRSKGPRRQRGLEVRLTPDQKRLIERAAALRGMNTSEFITFSALRVATEIIRDFEMLSLRDRERELFVGAILNPPAPNAPARAAAARYRERKRL